MDINRKILMTIVKNSSNRLEGEQEILEINEQQLHLINRELNKLFSLHVVSCSCADKEKQAYEKGWNDGASAAADDISVRI